jgi:hypothetical protein
VVDSTGRLLSLPPPPREGFTTGGDQRHTGKRSRRAVRPAGDRPRATRSTPMWPVACGGPEAQECAGTRRRRSHVPKDAPPRVRTSRRPKSLGVVHGADSAWRPARAANPNARGRLGRKTCHRGRSASSARRQVRAVETAQGTRSTCSNGECSGKGNLDFDICGIREVAHGR